MTNKKRKYTMKRFLTCALCFVSLPAIAVTLYYEQGGTCSGLYRSPGCTGTRVTHLSVIPNPDTTFTGFNVNGWPIVDANGYIVNNVSDILKEANLSSGTVIQQTYMCPNGAIETGDGECASAGAKVNVTLDTRGGSMAAPTSIKVTRGGNLGNYAPDRSSFDGAIFVGWAKSGQADSTATKAAVINDTPGATVTYRAVYSCPDGYYMNQYNVCVSDGDDYFDRYGNDVLAENLQCWRQTDLNGTYENYCHWNVKITFHNNNQGFNLTAGGENDNKELECYGGRGCGGADWCVTPEGVPNPNGALCSHLLQPKAADYWFRGYFRLKEKETPETAPLIVGENNYRAAYNNFYPKTMMGNTMSITGHAVVAMSDSIVRLHCRGELVVDQTTGAEYCRGMWVDNNVFSLDIYGGWARKCVQSTTTNCNETIGSAYYASQGFLKGRVKYDTSCQNGYTITSGDSTYNPQCQKETEDISITYQFVDQHGLGLSNCGINSATCGINGTYYLPSSTICGSGNTLKYLGTYSGLYTPGHGVSCSSNVFGSIGSRIVTGYVCRNSCTIGQNVPNGTCTPAYRQGGRLNGNEYVENIYEGCNQISCDAGYMPGLVNNSVACVPKCEFGNYCTLEACNSIGGTCQSVSSSRCLCVEGSGGRPLSLSVGFTVDENITAASDSYGR